MDWLFYENEAKDKGYNIICGVDEAGRGPLAGPVFAAAVILPEGHIIEGVNDSKKLSEKRRDALYDKIIDECVCYSIGTASEKEIDEINILQATFLAMKRAVDGLEIKPDLALVDGNRVPPLDMDVETIVKGDGKSASIAAASIIAKVARDRYMLKLAEQYPQYEFERHKGYPTKLHYEKIYEYGISDVHRISFLKKVLENNE
ncbi:MAG: ribonuclease HII [Eubacterium sp.]|nr:ribonuclease HII [Eubacterium sp.]